MKISQRRQTIDSKSNIEINNQSNYSNILILNDSNVDQLQSLIKNNSQVILSKNNGSNKSFLPQIQSSYISKMNDGSLLSQRSESHYISTIQSDVNNLR